MQARTDRHNNPTAFSTAVAEQAGLVLGTDYSIGDLFGGSFYTARIIGDPLNVTIRVIDAIGYYTHAGAQRWSYIGIPHWLWMLLAPPHKRDVIGFHYQHEGGTEMRKLFPNYGEL